MASLEVRAEAAGEADRSVSAALSLGAELMEVFVRKEQSDEVRAARSTKIYLLL